MTYPLRNVLGTTARYYFGNIIIRRNTTEENDVVVTGNLTIAHGINYTVHGRLRTGGSFYNDDGLVTVDGDFQTGGDIEQTGSGTLNLYGNIIVGGHFINSGANGVVNINGSLDVNGYPSGATGFINGTGGTIFSVAGRVRCNYITNTTGLMTFWSDVQTYGAVTTTAGTIIIGGNLHCSAELSSTTGTITIYGKAYVRNTTTVSGNGGILHIYGDAVLIGAVGATNAGASIIIDGVSHIYGAITATGTVTYHGELFVMDFWSVPQLSVIVPAGAADRALPDIVVGNLPNGARTVKATLMLKFRSITNAGAVNMLNGAQHIQLQRVGGAYVDAISLITDQFTVGAAAVDAPGDVVIGDHNTVAQVDRNATYNCQWTAANADVAGLTFNDVQMGLKIWYAV